MNDKFDGLKAETSQMQSHSGDPTPTLTIRQNEVPGLYAAGRIGDYPVAFRAPREILGGGFADQERHPNTWTVYFLIDGQWALVESARGHRREWSSLDRLEAWLRTFGFQYFWVRNELDPTGEVGEGHLPDKSIK